MQNSGMSFIGILLSLLIIAILTITLIKNNGRYGSETADSKNIKKSVEKAKAVECRLKIDAINKEVAVYKITNEKFPNTLDEITTDYLCPVVNMPYQHDRASGRVWCPKHDQG